MTTKTLLIDMRAQVKIRGQRVNINEIETVINDCAGVDKTVVLCHRFSEISNVIVAYYTTLSGERQTRIESELTEASRKCLPVYMRPKLLHLGEIPLQVCNTCLAHDNQCAVFFDKLLCILLDADKYGFVCLLADSLAIF